MRKVVRPSLCCFSLRLLKTVITGSEFETFTSYENFLVRKVLKLFTATCARSKNNMETLADSSVSRSLVDLV